MFFTDTYYISIAADIMKILIFYTPRSKSTMAAKVLAKRFNLREIIDPLVLSKIKNQNTSEFPKIIQDINQSQNICVKISSSDFLDSKNRRVIDYYKDIDFDSFNKIVFITRNDVLSAALSFTYMDGKNKSSWHRQRGEEKLQEKYCASLDRVYYLLRSYKLYCVIKNYITDNFKYPTYYEYEFDTINEAMKTDFDITEAYFDIDTIDNDLDYKNLVTNLDDVIVTITKLNKVINRSSVADLNKFDSPFWNFYSM